MKATKQKDWSIFIIAFVVFLIWQLPSLGIIRYPFILLGTWFHEMSHGLTSIFLGGSFHHLEIYETGGGVAYTSQDIEGFIPYRVRRALVAAGGLMGPCVFGAGLIIASAKPNRSVWFLRGLIILIVASILIWIRSLIGTAILSLIVLILIIISSRKSKKLAQWTLLFLGIQCTFSTYLQLNYLFTGTFVRNGQVSTSDTQVIAESLFGTYWFWAIIIICISISILLRSYNYYLRNRM